MESTTSRFSLAFPLKEMLPFLLWVISFPLTHCLHLLPNVVGGGRMSNHPIPPCYEPHYRWYPRSYLVQRISPNVTMHIDGDILHKPVWQSTPWSEAFGDIATIVNPSTSTSDWASSASAWASSHASTTYTSRIMTETEIPVTQFKALYDDTHLYVAAILHPAQDMATEAHFTQRNAPIYQRDSDFEIFIDPSFDVDSVSLVAATTTTTTSHSSVSGGKLISWNHNYKELEINALNTVWNLLLDKPYRDGGREHSGRVAPDNPQSPDYYEVYHQSTATSIVYGAVNVPGKGALWTVEMALAYSDIYAKSSSSMQSPVPLPSTETASTRIPSLSQTQNNRMTQKSLIHSPLPPGTFWRVNFSRVEQRGSINWTWQPQIRWDPDQEQFRGFVDMHLPDAWGYLVFGDDITTEGNNSSGKLTGNNDPDRTGESFFRDPLWPAKFTASCLYYAQHHHKERYGRFTDQVTDLRVPSEIIGPFQVTMEYHTNQTFTVQVEHSKQPIPARVWIRQDRLMTVEWLS